MGTEEVRIWESWVGREIQFRRFGKGVNKEETDRQFSDRKQLLKRVPLEKFNPPDEEQLEDWVDKAAGTIWRSRLCFEQFHGHGWRINTGAGSRVKRDYWNILV